MNLNRKRSQMLCESFLGCSNLENWYSYDIHSLTLNRMQANTLKQALQLDAKDHYYKGILSFAEAINGIRDFRFSWPTIKLYYSVYYLLRSFLYLNDIAFIRHKSLYTIRAKEGETPKKKSNKKYNSDHQGTIYYHIDLHSERDILLSNKIDEKYAYEWMLERREDINYRYSKFSEPEYPQFWETLIDHDVHKKGSEIYRKIIEDDYVLTFQEEFACLSIPVKVLQFVNYEFKEKSFMNFLSSLQIDMIDKLCNDDKMSNWILGGEY